jgi:hypothetical protein
MSSRISRPRNLWWSWCLHIPWMKLTCLPSQWRSQYCIQCSRMSIIRRCFQRPSSSTTSARTREWWWPPRQGRVVEVAASSPRRSPRIRTCSSEVRQTCYQVEALWAVEELHRPHSISPLSVSLQAQWTISRPGNSTWPSSKMGSVPRTTNSIRWWDLVGCTIRLPFLGHQ